MSSQFSTRQNVAPFGDWLLKLRNGLGLPQWKVGAAIGVDAQTYGKFESQKRWPKGERLQKLAHVLRQPVKKMQARMALAKAMIDCDDIHALAQEVEETQAAYGNVNNFPANSAQHGRKKK